MTENNFVFNDSKIWEYLYRHTFLSKKFKLLYIATPKVACTSLKWWFASLEGYSKNLSETTDSFESDPDLVIHDRFPVIAPEVTGLKPESIVEPIFSEEYFRFAVVRNPYKRLFSAWQSKILLREPLQSSPYLKYDFFGMPIKNAHDIALAFDAFLLHLVSREAPNYWDDHWTPQIDILRPDIISYTKLAQIENPKDLTLALAKHLGPYIPDPFSNYHKNESLIPYSPAFFTKRAVAMIQSLYGEDFKAFGYDSLLPEPENKFSKSQLAVAAQALQLIRGRHERLAQIRATLSAQIANLDQSILEKDQEVQQINMQVADRDVKIDDLNQLIGEKDKAIQQINILVSDRDVKIDGLNQLIGEKDQVVQQINMQVADRDGKIDGLNQLIGEKDQVVQQINMQVADRDVQIDNLNQLIGEKDQVIQQINILVSDRNGEILNLHQISSEQELRIQELQTLVTIRDRQIISFNQTATVLNEQRSQLLLTHSWRVTRPIRFIVRCLKTRGITLGDRDAIIQMLRTFSIRLSFLARYRAQLSRLFFRITGWSRFSQVKTQPDYIEEFCDPNISLNVPDTGNQDSHDHTNIVPFWGARNQYGKRRVAILTNMLLDWSDGRPRFGGGERYALELARLLQDLGLEVTFFQPSFKGYGEGEYFGFRVKTFPPSASYGEFHYGACTYFTNETKNYDHVYYHLPEYASGMVREDGLMTCHGVWFDHNNYPGSFFRTREWFTHLYQAFFNPQGIVSVDTHSISLIRSIWPEISSRINYIPNFFDSKNYFPDYSSRKPEKLLVLFPRRSQINRGSRIFPHIVDGIPFDVSIEWVGEGDEVDVEIIRGVCVNDERVKFRVAEFDEMSDYYKRADIVVIPSIASEGTSLSCIEALASGCAVVATNIGGLNDLIHDGLNGLLVDPNPQSISSAINYLIENDSERQRLQKIAPESVAFLDLIHWRSKWVKIFLVHGWIDSLSYNLWNTNNINLARSNVMRPNERWVILTRNAIHGGVESIIREQSKLLDAPVVVCGGHEEKDTCPFKYVRADNSRELRDEISEYDMILYHWLPNWALDVIKESGKFSMEFVHRIDTCDNDKNIPAGLLTHSRFLAKHLFDKYGKFCRVIEHPIDTTLFIPSDQCGKYVGAITSYYETKGIDIFLRAWSRIKQSYPDLHVRFYGSGDQQSNLEALAKSLGIHAEFCPPTKTPWEALPDFKCFVLPSRIEGFPMAILEALAMNIPVVASDLEGVREFNLNAVRRGHLPYIQVARNGDVDDFAKVMCHTLDSVNTLKSTAYISEYFTPQRHLDGLLNAKLEFGTR